MLNFLKRKRSLDRKPKSKTVLPAVDQVGLTAGDVWGLLAENGEIRIARLVKLSSYSRDEVLLAIGWLAREGKIQLDGTQVSLISDEQIRAA